MNRNWTIREYPTKYDDIKTYTILEANPDAGKSGVCYSGSHLAICSLDSKEDAQFIVTACNNYDALVRFVSELAQAIDEGYERLGASRSGRLTELLSQIKAEVN
jgi:hypothetical protein